MSDEPENAETAEAAEPRRNTAWRGFRKSKGPRLAPEAAQRQGLITHLAFSLLGGRDPAILFLNQPDSSIGGTPLEIATASGAGYEQVELLIRRITGADSSL